MSGVRRLFGDALGVAVRHHGGAPGISKQRDRLRGATGAQLEEVLGLAARENLDALVAEGLALAGLARAATDVDARRIRVRARAALFFDAASAISRLLFAANVDHVFVKGLASDLAFHGGRGLRGFSDIDILAPDGDAAERALAQLGLSAPSEARTPHLATIKIARTHLVTWRGTVVALDLHTRLLLDPPFRDPSAECLSKTRQFDGLPTLCLEHALAFAAANAAADRFSGVWRAATDLAAAQLAGQVDAAHLVDVATRWRARRALAALAEFTATHLGVDLPVRGLLGVSAARRRVLARLTHGDVRGAFTRGLVADDVPTAIRAFASNLGPLVKQTRARFHGRARS